MDQHFDHPVIKVLAASPRLEALQTRLRQAGFRPIPASFPVTQDSTDPILVDIGTTDPEQLDELLSQAPENQLVFLGELPSQLANKPVLHLYSVDQIPTLLARLAIRQREVRRKQEYTLRKSAAEKLGQPEKTFTQKRKPRVLFLGDSSQKFTALSHSLKVEGVDIVAALSVLTAQDYLSSGEFDAVLLHPQAAEDEASKFLDHASMTLKSAFADIFVLEEPNRSASLSARYLEQIAQLIDASRPADEIASLIAQQVVIQPTNVLHKADNQTAAQGISAKVFSLEYLKTYLPLQFHAADMTAERLTVISLDFRSEDHLNDATPTIIAHLRNTDLAARLCNQSVAIVLPATAYRGAVSLARRIEAALPCSVSTRVVERRQYHTVLSLLAALGHRTSRRLPPKAQAS
ncbi:MAG: hypothetical protein Hens3KO_12140 [Henriciella sp.]